MAGQLYKRGMIRLILRFATAAAAFLVAAHFLPGVHVQGWEVAAKAALALALLNVFVRPVLSFLALPLSCLTVGLFSLVINGFVVWLVGAAIHGVRFDNFLWAMAAAMVISMVNAAGHLLFD